MTTVTLERVYEDVKAIKRQLNKLSLMLEEDFELSGHAKKELEEARKTPRSEYISQKEMEKEFLIAADFNNRIKLVKSAEYGHG